MDFKDVIAAQRRFFLTGATRTLQFRRDALRRLAAALEKHEDALLAALYDDLRKPTHEACSSETGFVLSEVRHALRHLHTWMHPRRCSSPLIAWPARSVVQPEPLGVALIIGPWNYPVQLLLTPLVGALAAGNCAVLKTSEHAPTCATAITDLVRATFPAEHVTVVNGGAGEAQCLLRERFDKIFFTGSTRIGRQVMAAAAHHLTPVTLELGGKSPCIVCADAPVELTARRIAWGKFMNCGQTCTAPDFVVADRRICAALVEALTRTLHQFYGSAPRQSPDYGRIINRGHFERLIALLDRGTTATGGDHDTADLYIAPTVLTDVPWDAPVMQEEIFGPILPVIAFDDVEDVLQRLRERPTPLALYVFTQDRRVEARILAAVRSGGVCVNDTLCHMLGKELPFGGLGDSGMGACHGRAGFDSFSHQRSVMRRSFAFDSSLRCPPPRLSLSALRRAMRWLLRG